MKTPWFISAALILILAADCSARNQDAEEAAMQACHLGTRIDEAMAQPTNCDSVVAARFGDASGPAFTKVATDLFCEDPYDAVCGASGAVIAAKRRAQIQPLQDKAKKAALLDVALQLKVNKPKDFTEADIAKLEPESNRKAVEQTYHSRLAAHAIADGGAISQIAINKAEASIRESLSQAIRTVPGLTDVQRAAFLAIVAKTIIFTDLSAKMMKAFGKTDISDKLYEECGPDGLENNAFASKDSNNNPIIIVCPGTLFAAPGAGADASSNFFALLQTLGHELGHQFDTTESVADGVYGPMEACLEKYHALPLNGPDKLEAGEVESKIKVRSHIREIVADFWGTQTAVQYIKALKPALDRKGKLHVLRESWEDLCGAIDKTGHPNDRFRIEVLLRSDPAIHELMECKDPPAFRMGPGSKILEPSLPGCTLAGPTKKEMF